MGPDHAHPSHTAAVIDLAAISGRQLVAIYDQIRSGQPPRTQQFGDALSQALRDAPRPPGRLGRVIALLIDGGPNATKADIDDAFERLRHVTTIRPLASQRPPPPVLRRRARRTVTSQQPLPGTFDQLATGATP
ncbi:MAG: hypothetical protein AB7W59_00465 [Acidimicrobiia bacterium]